MKNNFPDRTEIFLALALKQLAQANSSANADFMPSLEAEAKPAEISLAGFDYLSEREREKFRRVQTEYEQKSDTEKTDWQNQILGKIGADESLIDERVHYSHINEALQKEIPVVQKIIVANLPNSYRKSTDTFTGRKKKAGDTAELKPLPTEKDKTAAKAKTALDKTIRRAFATQFVHVRDLKKPTAFDRLSGNHLARLIRLTGIREVALACVRIEAVESVAAFLRIFSAEDAQAIAAQLNSLAEISETRLAFAENLVQTTLEAESQPSAMLDLLGISLIGVALIGVSESRVQFTNQKLPLEIAPKLPEIIGEQSSETSRELRSQIKSEIETLAETLASHGKRQNA